MCTKLYENSLYAQTHTKHSNFQYEEKREESKNEINAIATFPCCAFVCAFLLDTVSLTLFSPSLIHLVLLFIFRWCVLVLALFPYFLHISFFFGMRCSARHVYSTCVFRTHVSKKKRGSRMHCMAMPSMRLRKKNSQYHSISLISWPNDK